MSKDHVLFVFATLLIAIHTADGTIQAGESFSFYMGLFVLPLVIVSFIWHKMKDIIQFAIAIIFLLLELNYAATESIPALMNEGVTNLTRNTFFLIAAIIVLLIIIGMVSVRVYRAAK